MLLKNVHLNNQSLQIVVPTRYLRMTVFVSNCNHFVFNSLQNVNIIVHYYFSFLQSRDGTIEHIMISVIPQMEFLVSYFALERYQGIFSQHFSGKFELVTSFNQSSLTYDVCSQEICLYNYTSIIAQNCIQFLTGNKLISLLEPICGT